MMRASSPRAGTPTLGQAPAGHLARLPRRPLLVLLLLTLAMGQLTSATQAEEAGEGDTPTIDAELLAEALKIIDERYVDGAALTTENLTAGAIRGMVEALGDENHTQYLTPEERAAEQDALDGRVIGIGVVLEQRSNAGLVISVIDGSPADVADLRAGDVIASVDDQETSRLPLDAIAELVRGRPGTSVRIGIERPGEAERREVRIIREDIEIEPADWARVPGTDVAVVRIVQFSVAAGYRTREAVEAALADGAMGIVLDLRGNPGGLVDEAVDVVAAFVDGGVAYREQSRDGSVRDVSIPGGRVLTADLPVVVLVDYGTASSAEILAAALRDNGRAAIVGGQTFGTGTVLNTFDLSDGSALKVGVRSWLTPAGEAVFRVGITPDHVVEPAPGAAVLRPADLTTMTAEAFSNGDDLPLRRAVGLLEPLAIR